MNKHKKFVEDLLAHADVQIGGDRPWDIKVNDERLYSRMVSGGTLALGESYMDGWWDCAALDQFFEKVIRSNIGDHVQPTWLNAYLYAQAWLTNPGSSKRAYEIGEKHYDAGNDLFKAMLDKRLVYTCGYWEGFLDGSRAPAKNLDEAQEAKLDLVCRKIGLKKGDKILDIGCGWGSFAKFAAEKYGARVVGVTVSKEQKELADELCKGLQVEIRLQDYRDVTEKFDHIISLGMFEHVGVKNYRTYMEVAARCLKDDGLFLLHTIGSNVSHLTPDPWFDKYIFPGGILPSIAEIARSVENVFIIEDLQNFGFDYSRTLFAWNENFEKAWPQLESGYNERFHRMWRYYLLLLVGGFRARNSQLWQIVLSKKGVKGGYHSFR